MALEDVLEKLTKQDKLTILQEVVIRPMVEVDKSLSQEELSDALLAGSKMGFTPKEIQDQVEALVAEVGAVIEDE